jgi:hypothetical protein
LGVQVVVALLFLLRLQLSLLFLKPLVVGYRLHLNLPLN